MLTIIIIECDNIYSIYGVGWKKVGIILDTF